MKVRKYEEKLEDLTITQLKALCEKNRHPIKAGGWGYSVTGSGNFRAADKEKLAKYMYVMAAEPDLRQILQLDIKNMIKYAFREYGIVFEKGFENDPINNRIEMARQILDAKKKAEADADPDLQADAETVTVNNDYLLDLVAKAKAKAEADAKAKAEAEAKAAKVNKDVSTITVDELRMLRAAAGENMDTDVIKRVIQTQKKTIDKIVA